ncbi:hypothetical protein HD601_003955 [Jiangella mangrovi]|uniref:Uncharacterized protein n=1 Tax=Jiangella mangrovi TaxID=1524084 RepID=A0A7W9GSR9_9ACTN|nr:hypothetical protein [Jiangella mangrovi]
MSSLRRSSLVDVGRGLTIMEKSAFRHLGNPDFSVIKRV